MVKAMVSAAFSSAVFPQLAVTLPAGNEETNGLLQRLLGVDSDPAQAQRFAAYGYLRMDFLLVDSNGKELEDPCCNYIYVYIYMWSPPHDLPRSILYGNYNVFLGI